MDFKNVQRRVYDALNVLSAMDIIRKDKYNIIYNDAAYEVQAKYKKKGFSSFLYSPSFCVFPTSVDTNRPCLSYTLIET